MLTLGMILHFPAGARVILEVNERYRDVTPIDQELDSGTGSRAHTVPVTAAHMRSGDLARLTGVSADSFRFADKPPGTSPTSAGSHRPEHGVQQILFYLKLVRSARGILAPAPSGLRRV